MKLHSEGFSLNIMLKQASFFVGSLLVVASFTGCETLQSKKSNNGYGMPMQSAPAGNISVAPEGGLPASSTLACNTTPITGDRVPVTNVLADLPAAKKTSQPVAKSTSTVAMKPVASTTAAKKKSVAETATMQPVAKTVATPKLAPTASKTVASVPATQLVVKETIPVPGTPAPASVSVPETAPVADTSFDDLTLPARNN